MKVFISILLFSVAVCHGKEYDDHSMYGQLKNVDDELRAVKDELLQLRNEKKKSSDFDYVSKRAVGSSNLGSCNLEERCFEDTFVQNDGKSKFKWNLKVNREHTVYDSEETSGNFLEADVKNGFARNEFAKMSKEFALQANDNCLAFRYYMGDKDGCDTARLIVNVRCGTTTTELVKENIGTDRNWALATGDFKGTKNAKCTVEFTAAKGLYHGKLFIDAINLHPEACPTGDINLPSILTCTFQQKTFCDWKESGSLPINFDRWSGSSIFGAQQPFDKKVSHTNGYFAFVSSPTGNLFQKTATLTAPTVFSIQAWCMRMAVNMFGKDVNELKVTLNGKAVVLERGNKGSKWFEKWIDLPADQENKIEISMTTGDGIQSDIAIDNIIAQTGTCKSNFNIKSCGDFTPCKITYKNQQYCKATTKKDTINGITTNVVAVEYVEDRMSCEYNVYLDLNEQIRSSRLSCFSFDYLVPREMASSKRCLVKVEVIDETTQRKKKIMDVSDGYVAGQWRKVKMTLDIKLQDYSMIGLSNKLRKNDCEEFSYTNLHLTSGPCTE